MDKQGTQMEPQDAPLKNTDQAFVRVREDGSPDMSVNDQPSHDDPEQSAGQERSGAESRPVSNG